MALNGGVSLAIWMGGCAVELDAARRAHRGPELLGPPQPGPPRRGVLRLLLGDRSPPECPEVPRTLYHGLCDAFDRQLVIDLMSGASAGGINGALLSCAITYDRRLHPDFLRDKWLDLGDIARLLHRTSRPDVRSLMRGRYFHESLRTAFTELIGTPNADGFDPAAIPATQPAGTHDDGQLAPSLDITTTDIKGTERTYADAWGGTLVAREHRARFAFREPSDYTAENLATASRSSASFPVAFEPWAVEDDDARRLAHLPERRLVIDGGVLDNAPIKAVIDLIPERPAERQVKRYVCYLNADPPLPEKLAQALVAPDDPEDSRPETTLKLFAIAKAIVSLPKKAPFVDQLDAVERVTSRTALARSTEVELLFAPDAELRPLATTLLQVYRERRRLVSLEEMIPQPAIAAAAFTTLADSDAPELPWIPTTLPQAGATIDRFGFGLRPAQRAIHLLLDALRLSVVQAQEAERFDRVRILLAARGQVYHEHVVALTEQRTLLLRDQAIIEGLVKLGKLGNRGDVAQVVKRLHDDWCRYEIAATAAVRGAAASVQAVVAHLGRLERTVERGFEHLPLGDALFGGDGTIDSFIRRACYAEVIRRAFDSDRDIDSAQRIGFVQLTPFTRIPILASGPRAAAACTPEDKLAGIRLGHFAAFYRRSWRANDFMWGRLDASTRIVQLLVDHERAKVVSKYRAGPAPWERIADCLLPATVDESQVWLVREWLDAPDDTLPALRTRLTAAIRADLQSGKGDLTRDLCTRAVQLEILRQELPVLDKAAIDDRGLGASSKPLKLMDRGLRSAIEGLRPGTGNATLPARLDARGRMEIGSNLGVRTVTHALFVSLAMLRFAKVPFSLLLYSLRAALFPLAGAVSRVGWYRLAVVLGFWSASAYLASRVLDTAAACDAGGACEEATVNSFWSNAVLLNVVALLAVFGFVTLAVLRAVRAPKWTTLVWHGLWTVALLVVGGAAAVGGALFAADVPWANLVASTGADSPPDWLQTTILLLVLGLPLARLFTPVRSAISRMLKSAKYAGPMTALLFAVLTAWLLVDQLVDELVPRLGFDGSWQTLAAMAATFGAPILAAAYVSYSWLRGATSRLRRKLAAAWSS